VAGTAPGCGGRDGEGRDGAAARGEEGLVVVCRAGHGLAAGDRVPLAPVGAELPDEELVRTSLILCDYAEFMITVLY
jgi:hypothetical protein